MGPNDRRHSDSLQAAFWRTAVRAADAALRRRAQLRAGARWLPVLAAAALAFALGRALGAALLLLT